MATLHALVLLGATATVAQARPRVVSINLCTDQLLLTLADAEQISGLSPYARDRQRSWAAADAERFPRLSGAAEDVLVLKPDLVLAGRYTKRATRDILKQQGLRVIELEPARSIGEAKTQIRQVGDLLGRPDRADIALRRIDGALARARAAFAEQPVSVLPLMRRGWVAGRDTLLASLLEAAGLRNAGGGLARPAGSYVSLEAIISARPDRLLTVAEEGPAEDQGSALLHHSVLERLFPAGSRIVMPESLVSCGGPMVADALDVLAAAAQRSGPTDGR